VSPSPTTPDAHLPCIVLGRLEGRSSRRSVALGHAAVNDEVSSIDEAALVASKEEDTLSLLNGLAKTTSREVNFATVALLLVVTEPVLKERGAVVVSTYYTEQMLHMETYFNGAGHSELNLKPSRA
jgi:hypothetical protein